MIKVIRIVEVFSCILLASIFIVGAIGIIEILNLLYYLFMEVLCK